MLPHKNPRGHDHFDHVGALVRELNRRQRGGAVLISLSAAPEAASGRWGRTLSAPGGWMRAVAQLRRARKEGCETFFVHYSYLGLFAARWVTRRWGGKALYWHCGEPWLYAREDPWGSGWILRGALRSADLVLTGTATLRREYVARFGLKEERVTVLPSWVDPWGAVKGPKSELQSKLRLPVRRRWVLFAHRLSVDRGCMLLPELVRRVGRRVAGVRWIVAGDGPARKPVESEATRLGVRNVMDFRGWVAHSEMKNWFAASDVLVVPSLRAGVPRNVLEAFAMGLPVVATSAGGTGDLFEGPLAPFCVPPGDVGRFADGVVRLLTDDHEVRRFARLARAAARPHHVRAVAGSLLSLVEGLR